MNSKNTQLKSLKTISECVDTDSIYVLEFDPVDHVFLLSNIKIDQSEIDTVVKSKDKVNGMSDILDSQSQFKSKNYILNNISKIEQRNRKQTLSENMMTLEVPSTQINKENYFDIDSNIQRKNFFEINQKN